MQKCEVESELTRMRQLRETAKQRNETANKLMAEMEQKIFDSEKEKVAYAIYSN